MSAVYTGILEKYEELALVDIDNNCGERPSVWNIIYGNCFRYSTDSVEKARPDFSGLTRGLLCYLGARRNAANDGSTVT